MLLIQPFMLITIEPPKNLTVKKKLYKFSMSSNSKPLSKQIYTEPLNTVWLV